jgi:hypothetical protein
VFRVEQGSDDWPTFRDKVNALNEQRLAKLAEQRGHGTTH